MAIRLKVEIMEACHTKENKNLRKDGGKVVYDRAAVAVRGQGGSRHRKKG